MCNVLKSIFAGLASTVRTRASLQMEILALRHQLVVLQRTNKKRLRLRTSDRILWIVLSRFWPPWRECLMLVKPDTVIAWHRKPPSQPWRTFLENHVNQLVSVDFFVVPTVTFRILYVILVLARDRRRIVHFNVSEHPTAEWTAAQIVQAFPWDKAPRFLLRDRDSVYGVAFRALVKSLDISEVLTAFRSPWQSPYVERLIGSIRRECLGPRRHPE